MAELEEIVIENLREWIFDENKIVRINYIIFRVGHYLMLLA